MCRDCLRYQIFLFFFSADLVPEAGTVTRIGSENGTVTATIKGGAAKADRGITGGVAGLGVVTADVRGNVNATIGAVAVLRNGRTESEKPASASSRKVRTITKGSSSLRT